MRAKRPAAAWQSSVAPIVVAVVAGLEKQRAFARPAPRRAELPAATLRSVRAALPCRAVQPYRVVPAAAQPQQAARRALAQCLAWSAQPALRPSQARAPFRSSVCRDRRALPCLAEERAGAAFGWATTLTTGAGAAAADFNSLRTFSSSGLPGLASSFCLCAANPAGAAGGAVRATTGRSSTRAGGLSPCAAAPRTLFSVGATTATAATG